MQLPKLKGKKVLIPAGIIVASLVLLLVWLLLRPTKTSDSSNQQTSNKSQYQDTNTVRLIATGDMIPHDAINQEAKNTGQYDYKVMFANMKPFFNRSDIRFCNQAVPAGGDAARISGYPIFNSPTEFSRDMVDLGCNVINTGSNHTNDKGQPVIKGMLDYWDTQNVLAIAGANRSNEEQNKVRYFENNGLKFAFLAYSGYTNVVGQTTYGVNMFSREFATKQLTEARANSDFIIVSMRWGTEYSQNINANQDDIAQFFADQGVDVVYGHGPHVLQPVKEVTGSGGNKTLVWFSLGNFLNAQLSPEALFNGIAVMDIDKTSKEIKNVSYLPVYMHYEWTAEEAKREDLLKRKNFALYTLDKAEEPFKKSQLKTTIEAQRQRITDTLNKFMTIKILNDSEF